MAEDNVGMGEDRAIQALKDQTALLRARKERTAALSNTGFGMGLLGAVLLYILGIFWIEDVGIGGVWVAFGWIFCPLICIGPLMGIFNQVEERLNIRIAHCERQLAELVGKADRQAKKLQEIDEDLRQLRRKVEGMFAGTKRD